MAEFIVAIELGSSKITGIAGRKNLDGTMTVLALVVEDASQCIRKGVVNNIDKTAQSLTTIVGKLKKRHHLRPYVEFTLCAVRCEQIRKPFGIAE